MPSVADASLLDEVLAAAWRAPEVEELDGWQLRYGYGITGRANSAWPRRDDGVLTLDEKIARAEDFYREHRVAPEGAVSPVSRPSGLDGELARRGYERSDEVLIEVADTADVESSTQRDGAPEVRLDSEPDERWLTIWLGVRRFSADRVGKAPALLRASSGDAVFASIDDVAVGRGFGQGSWVVVTAMSTLPEARRLGAARAILNALAGWARARDAGRMCLPVESTNEPALALYENAGFTQMSSYWYRTAP